MAIGVSESFLHLFKNGMGHFFIYTRVDLKRVHHMISRIPNLQNRNFLHEIWRLLWSALNEFSFKIQNRLKCQYNYYLFLEKTIFFSEKQLQIRNSGFVKTCDEYVHRVGAHSTLKYYCSCIAGIGCYY